MTSSVSHTITPSVQRSSHRVWYLKVNDPTSHTALNLRLSVLSSRNGFKQIAEVEAVFFERDTQNEVKKTAIKQTYDIDSFSTPGGAAIRIGECFLAATSTQGIIRSKGNTIEWNLNFEALLSSQASADFRNRLSKNSTVLDSVELVFSGTTQVNGKAFQWNQALGMQGHAKEAAHHYSWIWAHCNLFLNEKKELAPFVFEGVGTRTRIGPVLGPQICSLFFHYQDRSYLFNTLKDSFFIQSKNTLNEWKFKADRDDLSFRGHVHAELKDFAGLTYEDVNGAILYTSSTRLSNMDIFIYRRGKLESTFSARGTASFEVVSREKNPYVPLLT